MTTAARPAARETTFSFVLEHPAADPATAHCHFAARLAVETDPADVKLDLDRGRRDFIVADMRSAEAYAQCHIPGAISLPHRSVSAASTAGLSKEQVIVVYCWGPACNAAQKGAARLAALGFQVKEMIGGLEYWRHEGHAVEGTLGADAPLYG
jgi:rhodanese-related sulfurtransferase